MRGRRAAVLCLVAVACLLLLPLLAPGPADDGPAAVTVAAAAETAVTGPVPDSGAEAAGESCPCDGDASLRRLLARTPRTGGAAAAQAPAAAAAGAVRDGAEVRATGPARAPGTAATPPRAVELQAFRC
ncbi:hypothetical protein ACH4C6_10420 [Streptomyces sp. NPDC017943]|uniref:hypothetical protein n=1 Tax=Streptomyces sp. NPDC017943 TaxID=3365019 RepID=UPI00379463B4